jgi:hypothetical protein
LITSARPGREFPRRQAAQGVEIGQHQARLMERPDHVLARRVVDGRLAAHRRIDQRQQGGRHLNEIDATLVDGRGKSGHVADHTAAEGHDQTPAVETRLQQRIEDAVQAVPGLVGFTGRQVTVSSAAASLPRPARNRGSYSGPTVSSVTIAT